MKKSHLNKATFWGRTIIFFLTFILCVMSISADDASAGDLLNKMNALLGPETDCFLRLRVSYDDINSGVAGRFFYFRSDKRHASLLYQVFPRQAKGYAFLYSKERYVGFNPLCGCTTETDRLAVEKRFGLSLAELDPRSLSLFTVRGEAVAGFLKNKPVFIIDLVSDNPLVPWKVYLSGTTLLPLRLERLAVTGKSVRSVDYLSYYRIGRSYLPRRILIKTEQGESLLVAGDTVSCRPLPDVVFTLSYLEEINR
jgi:hypothetical protein